MDRTNFLQQANASYLERLQEEYQRDPKAVDAQWEAFFAGFEAGASDSRRTVQAQAVSSNPTEEIQDLVHSYRELGHFMARLDPLSDRTPPHHPLLALSEFGLSNADLDRTVGTGGFLGPTDGTLRSLVAQLQATYCGSLGVEFMHVSDKEQRAWLQERMEPITNRPTFAAEESHTLLNRLVTAESFETFLQTKYLGKKRFSLEGGEVLVPLLDAVIEHGASLGVQEMVIGMPHRGRLNVLAHVLHKPYELILSEFEGTVEWQASQGDGDVKYHLGFSHDRITPEGRSIHCSLSYNPSHLELVDPVVEGIVRAKQQHRGDSRGLVVPILLHGEAAFTGQGIVPETLSLSQLPGYRVGGTVHVVVNNQVGFTATPEQTRFTPYPTDVARMIQAPIFHVNGDDPEAVIHAAKLAIAFRQQFRVDVVIDLWCYRRRGHNESDDPTFTQPGMYEKIAKHPTVVKLYERRLLERKAIEANEADQMAEGVRSRMTEAMHLARQRRPQQKIHTLNGLWKGLDRAGEDRSAETAVPAAVLTEISRGYGCFPEGFTPHSKLQRQITSRLEMALGKKPIDWGCAEMWAFGSLLGEGTPVRLAGQDCERGTFSHRHAVLHDIHTGARYSPLEHHSGRAKFTILNSMLSELAVLGFEYGYSSADPRTLVVWEAQFGDFVNGAQPVIDQFIVSAESKWLRMSGLVLLLPHGYEGQGPEHSSARLERFLQLCGDDNIQVCYPTRSAQYFHLLRRQMHRNFRKPLVVMTPKSLLRDDAAASSLEEFTDGTFELVIDDPRRPEVERVSRVLLCSGRVYYPLDAMRHQTGNDTTAIVRVEQLYPLPAREIEAILAHYGEAREVCWVQEEPRNMGAWSYIEPRLRELLPVQCRLTYVSREESATPATGLFSMHEAEEQAILHAALQVAESPVASPVPDIADSHAS